MQAIEASRQRAVSVLAERAPATAASLAQLPPVIRDSAPAVLAASDFVLDALARDDTLIATLQARGQELFAGAPIALPSIEGQSEDQFMAQLRRWRRAEFVRIAWRDLAGWAELDETLGDLSRAADEALRLAHQFALVALSARYGLPRSPTQSLGALIIV